MKQPFPCALTAEPCSAKEFRESADQMAEQRLEEQEEQ